MEENNIDQETRIFQEEKNHKETSDLLETIIHQNEKNKPQPELEAMIKQNEDTKKIIEESGDKLAEAVKELKPTLDIAGFVSSFMQSVAGNRGEKGDKGDKGEDGKTPMFTGKEKPQNPKKGDLWLMDD